MTYPDGRVIDYLYGDTESLDNHFGRVAGLKVDGEGQDLVTYSYAGAARYVSNFTPGADTSQVPVQHFTAGRPLTVLGTLGVYL